MYFICNCFWLYLLFLTAHDFCCYFCNFLHSHYSKKYIDCKSAITLFCSICSCFLCASVFDQDNMIQCLAFIRISGNFHFCRIRRILQPPNSGKEILYCICDIWWQYIAYCNLCNIVYVFHGFFLLKICRKDAVFYVYSCNFVSIFVHRFSDSTDSISISTNLYGPPYQTI